MRYNFDKLFHTGGVQKYQTPSGGITYNFDEFLDNLPTNQFLRGQSAQSIQWTPNWKGVEGRYANVKALEDDSRYKAFTDYVLNNYNKDSRVMDYLKLLEKTTTGKGHQGILFNGELLASNWQDEYKRLRNDLKYGYYHLGPNGTTPAVTQEPQLPANQEETTQRGTAQETVQPTLEGTDQEDTNQEDTPKTYDFPWLNKRQRDPYTSWLPLGLQRINDAFSNRYLERLEKMKKTPLVQTPRYKAEVGSDYLQQLQLDKAKSELFGQLSQYGNAGIEGYLQAWNTVYKQAGEIDDKKAQIHDLNVSTSKQNVLNTDNENMRLETEGSNTNRLRLADDYNRKITASQLRDLRELASRNSHIANQYKNWTEYLKTQRLNDIGFARGQMEMELNKNQQNALEEYNNNTSDVTKSSVWNEMINALSQEDSGVDESLLDNNQLLDTKKLKAAFADTNNKFFDPWREKWANYKSEQERNYYKKYWQNQLNHDAKTALLPDFVTGEGFWYRPNYYKKGGSVKNARFIDYMNHYQKEQQNRRASLQKQNDSIQKQLKRDLDALDRETLTLLRAVFK